ncbi:hypothetical protein BH20PSE1_BH20PSE1_27230 [soil metagenome]
MPFPSTPVQDIDTSRDRLAQAQYLSYANRYLETELVIDDQLYRERPAGGGGSRVGTVCKLTCQTPFAESMGCTASRIPIAFKIAARLLSSGLPCGDRVR